MLGVDSVSSFIKKNLVAVILAALALVMLVLAIGAVTWWRPGSQIVASQDQQTRQQVSITRHGVLGLYDSEITASAIGSGNVSVMLARPTDARAWAASGSYTEITGLSDIETLKGDVKTAPKVKEGTEVLPRNPQSDMWLMQESGSGSATLKIPVQDSDYSVVAYSESGSVSLTLRWSVPRSNPWFPILLVLAILLAIAALAVFFVKRAVERSREEIPETIPEVDPSQAAPITGEVPSRRSLREARNRGENVLVVDGVEFQTGLMPVVKPAAEAPAEVDTAVGALPSRKVLREARKQGMATIEVDGVEYPTGLMPTVKERPKTAVPDDGEEESSASSTPDIPTAKTASIPDTVSETEATNYAHSGEQTGNNTDTDSPAATDFDVPQRQETESPGLSDIEKLLRAELDSAAPNQRSEAQPAPQVTPSVNESDDGEFKLEDFTGEWMRKEGLFSRERNGTSDE